MSKKNSIVLTRLERQLLLYDIFYYLEEVERRDITDRLPIDVRMMQRDLQDLTDAGLIKIKYSGKQKAYIRNGVPAASYGTEARRKAHLQRLRRIGILMHCLENDEVDVKELFQRGNYISCAEHYRELFPEVSERGRQRDFNVLCRIGYPIVYIREIGYYAMWCENRLRNTFGVFREDGVLKRELKKTDLKLDGLAEQWPLVKEKMVAAREWQWWIGE